MTSSLNKHSFFSQTNVNESRSGLSERTSIHWLLTEKDGFERVVRIIQEYYDLEGDHSKGLTSFYKSLILKSKDLDSLNRSEDANSQLESIIASDFALNTNYFELSAGLEDKLTLV